MHHSIPLIHYVLALFVAPLVDAGAIAPIVSSQGALLLVIATFAWFSLPRSTWWRTSLLGGLWQDLYLLTPAGSTIVSVAVLGLVLTFMSRGLTSRSFWTDTATVYSALAAALVSQVLVGYVGAPGDPLRLQTSAFLFLLVAAVVIAVWARRDLAKHQYLR